jgi:hypothetical protein
MKPGERLVALKKLRLPVRPEMWATIEERTQWLEQVVPLLNFHAVYYDNILRVAGVLGRPGFNSSMYDHAAAQVESMVNLAIAELETRFLPSEQHTMWVKKEKHSLRKWWTEASLQERFGLLAFLAAIFIAGFLCARIPALGRITENMRQLALHYFIH